MTPVNTTVRMLMAVCVLAGYTECAGAQSLDATFSSAVGHVGTGDRVAVTLSGGLGALIDGLLVRKTTVYPRDTTARSTGARPERRVSVAPVLTGQTRSLQLNVTF